MSAPGRPEALIPQPKAQRISVGTAACPGEPAPRPADPFQPPGFSNPWSLRVFGLTLAAAEAGVFTLQEFQQALIGQIGAFEAGGHCIDSDEVYYTRWTEALTALLHDKQVFERRPLAPAEQSVRDALAALWHRHDDDHDDHPPAPQPVFVEAGR